MSGESQVDLGSRTLVLLSAARRGEAPAYRELVLRFAGPLHRLLSARVPAALRAVLDAEDMAQETWSSALRSLDGFEYRGVGSFWCWLRRIALNELAMQVRSATAAKRGPAEPLPDSGLAPRATDPGPYTHASRDDDVARLELALDTLEPRLRAAILLRIELDLPFDEIAKDCGFASADAARMAVTRGVKRMAEQLRSA